MTAEEDFAQKLLENIEKAERELPGGYVFSRLRDLIDDKKCAVTAARILVDVRNQAKLYDGYSKLEENGLLQYSVEQTIVDFAESGLFTKPEVQSAKARLRMSELKKTRRMP